MTRRPPQRQLQGLPLPPKFLAAKFSASEA